MSIQSEIDRIKSNVAGVYAAVSDMGGEVPEQQNSDNLEEAVRSIGGIPAGFIGMWSGSEVPDGWALCDGTNGTPDLQGRFVLGAGTDYSLGDVGGEATHKLTVNEMPKHDHELYVYTYGEAFPNEYHGAAYGRNAGVADVGPTGDTGGSKAHNNMPPYYVLAYIMKL